MGGHRFHRDYGCSSFRPFGVVSDVGIGKQMVFDQQCRVGSHPDTVSCGLRSKFDWTAENGKTIWGHFISLDIIFLPSLIRRQLAM